MNRKQLYEDLGRIRGELEESALTGCDCDSCMETRRMNRTRHARTVLVVVQKLLSEAKQMYPETEFAGFLVIHHLTKLVEELEQEIAQEKGMP